MAPYQGHRSWNAWNVALWIGNDEALYRIAIHCLRAKTRKGKAPSLNVAANRFLGYLGSDCRTPDGADYNFTCVREALAGLE